jgi:ASC-1-like (ASCH) protein
MSVERIDRLFIPLKSEPFEWFKSGKKKWELRGISSNFNNRTVFIGRNVEISKGYSGERIRGRITAVHVFKKIDDISKRIIFKEIIPIAANLGQFYEICKDFISKYNEFIVFKIELEK